MSLKLSELKGLHEKGLALIYLEPKTKKPFESGWTTAKPKSWDELENSFEKSYNVGVRLGEPSKLKSGNYLGAIDCDVKSTSRKAFKEMNAKLRELGIDLGSAPIVKSGRGNGSKHVYVQTVKPMKPCKFAVSDHKVKVLMPGETRPHTKTELKELTPDERSQCYRIRPAWEISFMGTGQQTVLPPSIHPDSGMAYAWTSPLTVKHCPLFAPEKFAKAQGSLSVSSDGQKDSDALRFKAEDVDLYSTKLSLKFIKMIETGAGCEDRSSSLLSIAMAMCRAQLTDNQILSVLSNPDNWIGEAGYDHTQSHDRARAVKWLYKYTLVKARYETDIMRRFENPPELVPLSKKEVAVVAEKIADDNKATLPDKDGNAKPKPTLRNMVHIMENWMGAGLVGFNEFSMRAIFLKDTPYGGVKGKEIADEDDLALKFYVASHYGFEPSQQLCFEAHAFIARRHGYHPVRQYLESLVWDQVPRLDSWLVEAFRASGPKEYLNAVGRKVLTAAVARVFDPGCKFDYAMVLEGNQGEGKSMSLEILASKPWFTDGIGDIHNKDVVDQMVGKWIIELGELAGVRGRENETIKAFFSRSVDRVRMSYGRRSQDYPRQSIFIGSTNEQEYFTDATGNRRYWPVRVSGSNRPWVLKFRDQLWAEAMMRYELGENLYLTPELEAVAKREQEKRFEVDEWEHEIKKIVSKDEGGVFNTTDLWRAINLTSGNGQPQMVDTKRIGRIMHRLGFIRIAKRIEGSVTKCWQKRDL